MDRLITSQPCQSKNGFWRRLATAVRRFHRHQRTFDEEVVQLQLRPLGLREKAKGRSDNAAGTDA